MKKIIYFTAGYVATSTELGEIAALKELNGSGYSIAIRNGADNASYGAGIEACDFVAGTVPTAFNGKTNWGSIDTLRPSLFQLYPKTKTLAALATEALTPIAITGRTLDALVAAIPATGVAYASSVPGKATVDASTGVVTAVATGATVITATYTYTSGKTVTATCAITVS